MKISAVFVKYNIDVIAPILHDIFNFIMQTGVVPSSWKFSFISQIPEKGSLTDIENDRGIAMQSEVPKLFDMLITAKHYNLCSK